MSEVDSEMERLAKSVVELAGELLEMSKAIKEYNELGMKIWELWRREIPLSVPASPFKLERKLNLPVTVPASLAHFFDVNAFTVTEVKVCEDGIHIFGEFVNEEGAKKTFDIKLPSGTTTFAALIDTALIFHLLKEQHGIDVIAELLQLLGKRIEQRRRRLELLERIYALIAIALR